MTTNDPKREGRESGYRGALPPRNDSLAVPWIGIVVAIFFLMFVLSALQIPSRFEPDPNTVALGGGIRIGVGRAIGIGRGVRVRGSFGIRGGVRLGRSIGVS